MHSLLALYLPILISYAAILNGLLAGFGFSRVYLFIILIAIYLMITFGKPRRKLNEFQFILQFIIFFSVACFVGVLGQTEIFVVASAWFLYVGFCLYWTIYYLCFDDRFIYSILKSNIPAFFIVSAIAAVQYFISPTFFGFLDNNTEAASWAINQVQSDYAYFFRPYSTTNSPQVMGLLMVFGFVLVWSLPKINHLFRVVCLIATMVGGVLSASKSFVLLLSLFLTYIAFKRLHRVSLASFFTHLIVIAIVIYMATVVSDEVPIFSRVISVDSILAQESEDSRIDRYLSIISNTPLIGYGAGAQYTRKETGALSAESYILYIYYELGILGVLSIFILWGASFVRALRNKSEIHIIFLVLCFVSWTFVHAFLSPAFFLFWALIIGSFSKRHATFGKLPPN
jgi:hypothetical protein